MAVTGQGTAESPYICESWEDLRSIGAVYFYNETNPETQPQYVTMSGEVTDKIIDFNDIAPDGLGSTNYLIVNVSKVFDGNEWTVTNLRTVTRGITLNKTDGAACLKNFTISNFTWIGDVDGSYLLHIDNGSNYDFQNIKAYMEVTINPTEVNTTDLYFNTAILKNCVIKMKITMGKLIASNRSFIYVSRTANLYSDAVVSNNNIELDIDLIKSFNPNYWEYILGSYSTGNTFIGNNITCRIHSSNGSKINPSNEQYKKMGLIQKAYSSSNIFNVKIEDDVVTGLHSTASCTGNLYNIDLLPEGSENNLADGFIGVTTDEMKDPAVLREKGFACYGVKV